MTAKQLRLSLILLALVGLFQNCSPPDVTSGVVAKTTSSSSTSSSSTSTSSTTKTALTTSYAPTTVVANNQVVITAKGGTAPYTYTKASGLGTLTSNVYIATSASESVTIAVKDSSGLIAYVYFAVGGGTVVVAATPTPTPTPAQAASTNGATTMPNGTVIGRSCDLSSLASYAQGGDDDRAVRGTVRYLICLAVGRNPGTDETQSYTDAIEDNDGFDPLTIPGTYFFSQEGLTRYNVNALSDSDFVLLTVRLLLRREPTVIERAGAVAKLAQGTSRQDLFYGIVGTYLVVEDKFLAAMTAKFKAAQD